MKPKRAVLSPDDAVRFWRESLGSAAQIALVANPSYVASSYELYPLAPANPGPLAALVGVVKDMDGTTTTTEPLCLHSLEWMVRTITDRMDRRVWAGFDHEKDHPNIIGNSTTRHVEYLLRTYGGDAKPEAFRRAFVLAVLWTLGRGRDERRRREVRATAAALGLAGMLRDDAFIRLVEERVDPFARKQPAVEALATKYAGAAAIDDFTEQVRAAVDIYYVRYHTILAALDEGRGDEYAGELGPDAGPNLVAPMPAVGFFLALTKGWLGERAGVFHDELAAHLAEKGDERTRVDRAALRAMGRYFAANPVRIAIVTSSIAYEADIVLAEVFRILREQAAGWPLPQADRDRIVAGFASHRSFYDAFITASDSSEIRLKPHRDLYSIALHEMGVARDEYDRVVGFEDSESGVVAIRAAGVGCCVALPFAQSAGHDFDAAVHVLHGQFPEVILRYQCFLSPEAIQAFA
ncbi:MAG: hypothetical protein JXA69_01020 [Phycisphaerae bacterium]|nr:hypothetical protein [Phycisphaerae bacterium]